MGSFSLLRAPIIALSDPLGGGRLLGYRLGALVCFIPALIVGGWLARESKLGPVETGSDGVRRALRNQPDHARRGAHGPPRGGTRWRTRSAGRRLRRSRAVDACSCLVGLAIGTKQWALLAVLPALFVAPADARRRMAAVAAAIGIVLALSAPLADWHDYREKAHTLGRTTTVSHYSAWTGVSRPVDIVVPGYDGPAKIHRLPRGLSREDISLMIPVVCTILVLAFARRRRWRLTEEDAVALLAISFVLRVTLDSTVLLYYFAPMVLALAWWEVRRRGIPLGTAAASVFIWQLFRETAACRKRWASCSLSAHPRLSA